MLEQRERIIEFNQENSDTFSQIHVSIVPQRLGFQLSH